MSDLYEPLEPARLVRDPSGTPYSEQYHDVYHARQGALEQARRVFLHGNGLPGRWHGRQAFTVCETGFGLGRNFLALWQAWREDPHRCARLHVLSFEAHPFSRADMTRADEDLPEACRPLARQLAQAWPSLLPGMHRLEFESGAITLTLAFGRVERMAPQVQAGVDAFFLDGFAPRVNPQMWTPALFGQMVRIARPGATAASWCTVGQVRCDLRDAGFLVSRTQGFGGGRDMMTAVLRPGLGREAIDARGAQAQALVVGAGPAGSAAARSLAERGLAVTVADPLLGQGPGAAHRGHKAVAVTPLLSHDDDPRARLVRAGVLRALHRWQALDEAARPWRCGSFVIPKNAAQAQRQQAALARLRLPEEWACWQTPEQVAQRLGRLPGRGGLWFGAGQLVRPEPLQQALLAHPGIRLAPRTVEGLSNDGAGNWRAQGLGDASYRYVVLANADGARRLLADGLQACPKLAAGRRVSGQVGYYAQQPGLPAARAITASEGYWLPAVEGWHTAGSTYWQDAEAVQVTDEGHADIRAKLKTFLDVNEEKGCWRPVGGWAGWRAVVAGRLPVIGEVPGAPGLWAACAFGSRGFTWAALAGDVIAAAVAGEPQLLERDLLAAVRPR